MRTQFYFFLITFVLASCSTRSVEEQKNMTADKDKINVLNILQDTVRVKHWLTATIEGYTNGADLKIRYSKMRSSLTDEYYKYKQDAINLEYDSPDGPMTKEEFHKKWSGKFNTKLVGNGGFFISSQDNGKVIVTICRLLQSLGDSATLYHVVIHDLDFKSEFIRDFKIIGQDNKLLIADIMEYD